MFSKRSKLAQKLKRGLSVLITLIVILGLPPITAFAEPASFFDTNLVQGRDRFIEVVNDATSNTAVFYELSITSSTTGNCFTVPGDDGSFAYVKATKDGASINFDRAYSSEYYHGWSVGVSSWTDVVNEGIKFEFFADSGCSTTPLPINAFGVKTQDWGTCCMGPNYTPDGSTALGTAIYTIFDGGTSGQSIDLLGNITQRISSTIHFVAEIDDREIDFTEVTVAPNGDGEAFRMGGSMIFSIVPQNSVNPGSGSTPSIPPERPDLTAATDLGVSSTDNLTSDTTPDFSVTYTPQNDIDFVNLYSGSTLIATSAAAGTTSETTVILTSAALSEGTHVITAKVENGHWHDESDPSPSLTVSIDITPPTMTITAAEVSDGDTSNDPTLSLTFSSSETTSSFAAGDVLVTNGSLSSFSGSGTTYTATLTPNVDGEVTINVPAASYKDNAGNDNLSADEFNWTSDQTNPTVTFNPLNGSTIVANAADIILTLSEPIRRAFDNADLTNLNVDDQITLKFDNAAGTDIPFDATIDGDKKVITIDPVSELPSNRQVYVAIGSSVEDYADNPLADSSATFMSADEDMPTLSGSSPSDGLTDVVLDADLILYFSEAVDAESGVIEIRRSSDNSLFESIDVAGVQISGSGTDTITVDISGPMESLTSYYVLIDETAFDDADGNSYQGISDQRTLDFETEFIDVTPPVVTFDPADGATDVSVSANVTLSFDEAIRNLDDSALTDSNVDALITLKDTNASGSDIAFDATIDGAKQVITINPSSNFSSEQVVYVAIGATVEDAVDNAISGESATFTVEDIVDPTIISTNPADGSTSVAANDDLIITFSEPVDVEFGTIKIYNASDNSIFESMSVTSATQVSGSGTTTITVTPANDFAYDSSYYVQIDATAFDDAAGNSFAGISDTTSWNFSTMTLSGTITCSPVSITTDEGTSNSVAANCTGSGLSYSVTQPLLGLSSNSGATLTFNPFGEFEYLGQGETDTANGDFTYTANNGTEVSTAADVQVTVTGVNDAPTANDDSVSTDEDTAFTTIDLVADNDTDPDTSDTIAVTGINTTGTIGNVTNNTDGTFTYDPNGQFESLAVGESTTDSFTYTIEDNFSEQDTATVTVTITGVNDAPAAVDDSASTDEDTSFRTANLVAANDSDPDSSDTLTVSGLDTSSTVGSVVSNGNGTFDYYPNGQFESLAVGDSTTDTFAYTISDGNGGSDTATVTVTINGVNDGPTAVDDGVSTNEDTAFTTIDLVADNDTDPDVGDTLSVTGIDTTGTIGQVTDNGNGTFDYDPDGQFESLGAGDSTTDTFTYTISDGNGGSDSATVTVTISGVNDGPTAVDDAVSTDEDTAFTTIDLVADNDTDPDPGDTLSVTGINTTGTIGQVTDNGNGTFDYDPNGQFESLAVGDSTTDTFAYTISDGNGGSDSATVTVTINGENDDPNAVDDSDSTPEDTAVTVDVLFNDSDIDAGDSLIVSAVTNGSHGSVTNNGSDVTYDPNPNYFGTDTFTYTVEDSQGATDTATVTITVAETDDMVVLGNSLVIANGDATPSSTDDTDFGSTALFLGTVEHTFTIENRGNIELSLTGSPRVSIGGVHPVDFSITTQPGTPVASSGTTTFSVEFDPIVAGTRTAIISIEYDDNVAPYTFTIRGTATAQDTDNDGIEDNVEGGGDRDNDGVPNYQDYDPTGYFYDEADGEIINGGEVSVSGPGVVTIVQNGSGGYYQFVTDGTAGTYTLAVTIPPGYDESSVCLQGDPPPFDPTGLTEPVVLGNGENANTGYLTSNACTIFYLTFDLAAGDPTIINNNIPLRARPLPDTGFSPGVMTELAEQTAEKSYQKMTGIWLDIPSMGVQAPLVGVPTVNGEWDVTWLGNQAGYLIGTAFPTWAGNTVITGHVWNPDNQPGIFVELKTLRYGDQIHIHSWGEIYTYQVQTNRLISPHVPKSVLDHKEGDWVTLFTCEEYGQAWGDYGYRRMVQSVLVSIKAAE